MKLLQALVPGCDKVKLIITCILINFFLTLIYSRIFNYVSGKSLQVTGKALMLDEIINYVQSLQNQVEVAIR